MRGKRLWKFALVMVGLCICCLGFSWWRLQSLKGAKSLLPYPAAWDQIQVGDSQTDAVRKCPDKHQEFHYAKGNFYYDNHFYGFWSMYIVYDSANKVQAKRFTLRIGTKEIFHDFRYGEGA
jgi:hypothetical protein